MKNSRWSCRWGLGVLALLVVGCTTTPDDGSSGLDPVGAMDNVRVGTEGSWCTPLLAGQHIVAGQVCVESGGAPGAEWLDITYTTQGGWVLLEAHAWAGPGPGGLPVNGGGSPVVGHFPLAVEGLGGTTSHTFRVDLTAWGNEGGQGGAADLCGMAVWAATHAVVALDADGNGSWERTETAWGAGTRIRPRGSWATWFSFSLECCQPVFDSDAFQAGIAAWESVPGEILLQAGWPGAGMESYFTARLDLDGDSLLETGDPVVAAWCLSLGRDLVAGNVWYAASLHSFQPDLSLLQDNGGNLLIARWENLDAVLWLLNQRPVGKPSVFGEGLFTYGDVQVAIWSLLEIQLGAAMGGLGEWSQPRVDELLSTLPADVPLDDPTVDYLPPCDGLAGVVAELRVVHGGERPGLGGWAQPLLMVVPAPCGGCE
jgi:hypothetical protein